MESEILMLFKEYGLDDKEIKVYSVLVGNKELTAYRIAQETRIHKSTCYDILERLISKGFVSKIEKGKKSFYSSLEIGQIITKLKNKESILLSLIPKLEKIRESKISKVRVFEGRESQKQFDFNLYNQISKGLIKELYILSGGPSGVSDVNKKDAEDLRGEISFEIFLEKLIKEIKRKKLYRGKEYKGIWNERFRGTKIVKLFSGLGEDRFLKGLPTLATTVIFGEYVAFMFHNKGIPQVIEIQNWMIAEEMKAYFGHLWKIARR